MISGKAFYVCHKGRRKHDYVSTDIAGIVKDIERMRETDWVFTVHVISFRGEGALSILTTVHDILDVIPERNRPFYAFHAGALIGSKGRLS